MLDHAVISPLNPFLLLQAGLAGGVHVRWVDLAQGGAAASVAHCLSSVQRGGSVGIGRRGQQADLAGGQSLRVVGESTGRKQLEQG